MNIENIIKLHTEGQVKIKDREFTRVVGGFEGSNPIITDLQIAELLGYSKGARQIRQKMQESNGGKKIIEYFDENIDVLDISKGVPDSDTLKETLVSLGYAKASITQAKNIYIFSESGFLLFLKFAEGEQAVNIYKDFIEDYFKTKAENKILKTTLQEQIENQYELYDSVFGKAIRKNDKQLFIDAEKIMNNIIELEKQLTEKITIEKYKDMENKYNKFLDSKSTYTFTETCKIISTIAQEEKSDIKISSSKLTEFLRESGILSKVKSGKKYNNTPNKQYEDYFNVASVDVRGKFNTTQTKVKSNGIELIYDLLKDKTA